MVRGDAKAMYQWGRGYHQLPIELNHLHDGENEVVSNDDKFNFWREVGRVDNKSVRQSQRIRWTWCNTITDDQPLPRSMDRVSLHSSSSSC